MSATSHETPVAGPVDRIPPSVATLGEVLGLMRRHRVLIVASTLLCGIAFAASTLLTPKTYTASASFILSAGGGDRARLGNVAAQFGISLAQGADPARSPDFYADLLTSRAILESVVSAPMAIDGRTTTLAALYADRDTVASRAVREAVVKLRDHITVRMETQTGLVSLAVSDRSPNLAERIASQLLETLNRFNMTVRRSQATAEREFITQQLGSARADLAAAEAALQSFLSANRVYQNSPELTLRRSRLEREISLRQQIYESLSQSLEQARIDEVRDTPVITIIDRPAAAIHADSRGLSSRLLIGLILGALGGTLLAFGMDYYRGAVFSPL